MKHPMTERDRTVTPDFVAIGTPVGDGIEHSRDQQLLDRASVEIKDRGNPAHLFNLGKTEPDRLQALSSEIRSIPLSASSRTSFSKSPCSLPGSTSSYLATRSPIILSEEPCSAMSCHISLPAPVNPK